MGETEAQSLPPPPDAESKGLVELIRLWHDDTAFSVQLRSGFNNPLEWSGALEFLAEAVAKLYAPEGTNEEMVRVAACTILFKALQSLGGEKQDDPEEEFDDEEDEEDEEDGDELGIEDLDDSDADGHPGSLLLPPEIALNPDAKQVLSVWTYDGVEECQGCGHTHPPETFVRGLTDHLSPEALGSMLGEIATLHSRNHVSPDEGVQLKALADIQKTFHDYLTQGVARA